MNETEIIGVVITALTVIVGLYVTVTNPILKVNQQLTELNVNQKHILSRNEEQEHKLSTHTLQLEDHEKRITVVEQKVK